MGVLKMLLLSWAMYSIPFQFELLIITRKADSEQPLRMNATFHTFGFAKKKS